MVNIYKLKLTILQQEILRLLFMKAGQKLNQRHIALRLDVSQPAVIKALPGISHFLKTQQDKESRRWSIEADRDRKEVIQIKRADNLRQIYESGLASYLNNQFPGAIIILFGSYSRGEDSVDSDIDLAIIGKKEKKLSLEEFEKCLERNLSINYYDSLKVHKDLLDSLMNGIVLAGSVQL